MAKPSDNFNYNCKTDCGNWVKWCFDNSCLKLFMNLLLFFWFVNIFDHSLTGVQVLSGLYNFIFWAILIVSGPRFF